MRLFVKWSLLLMTVGIFVVIPHNIMLLARRGERDNMEAIAKKAVWLYVFFSLWAGVVWFYGFKTL